MPAPTDGSQSEATGPEPTPRPTDRKPAGAARERPAPTEKPPAPPPAASITPTEPLPRPAPRPAPVRQPPPPRPTPPAARPPTARAPGAAPAAGRGPAPAEPSQPIRRPPPPSTPSAAGRAPAPPPAARVRGLEETQDEEPALPKPAPASPAPREREKFASAPRADLDTVDEPAPPRSQQQTRTEFVAPRLEDLEDEPAPAPAPLVFAPGDVLTVAGPDGKDDYYEIVGPLGEGGGGQVWTAIDDGARTVVVKGPRVAGDKALEYEAELLQTLPPHPCLPRLLGTVRHRRGHLLLVLERLFDNPLRALSTPDVRAKLGEKPGDAKARHAVPPPAVSLELGYELVRALEHLHQHRIAHCDVKPTNLLLAMDDPPPDGDPRGYFERLGRGAWRGVLIDLGGARRFRELNPRPGAGLAPALTPVYAPPEVLPGLWDEAAGRERSSFTPWIDSYAFGLTLYQLLTGREPYDHLPKPPDASLASIAEAKRGERDHELKPISRAALDAVDWSDTDVKEGTREQLTQQLWDLLERATHPEPARRATARQLRDALTAALKIGPRPPTEPGARDWIQRRLTTHAFEGRLARLSRGGNTVNLGKLRRGGGDFWEMQGYTPPST